MSLRDAVLEIVEEIETSPPSEQLPASAYAKLLRVALRSSEGGAERPAPPSPASMPPEIFHRLQIEAAKAEMRKGPEGARRATAEEEFEGRTVEVVGCPGYDPEVPTFTRIPAPMPCGARTMSAGVVCELRDDGKLHAVKD